MGQNSTSQGRRRARHPRPPSCFLGEDATTAEATSTEEFVWAAVYDAPVVFYCPDNHRPIYPEPTPADTLPLPFYRRASGLRLPRNRSTATTCSQPGRHPWALEDARSANGPLLVEAFTYRMDTHTTSDDPTRYRLADELELWKLKDPIERVRVHLVRSLEVGQEFFDDVAAEADALAARFRQFCTDMPAPAPDRIFSEVYAEESPLVAAQREAFLTYHASFEGA